MFYHVYITGSNAQMLSGELATLLSGRYIEISMLPLSFAEYFELVGGEKRDAWNSYPKFIISMDKLPMDEDGIKQVNIIDFLLSA